MIVNQGQAKLSQPAEEEDLLRGGDSGVGQRVKAKPNVEDSDGLYYQAESQINE